MNLLKEFLAEEDGFGVVEMLLIIAALVCVAMIFRKSIVNFVNDTAADVFGDADKEASDANTAGEQTPGYTTN